MTTLKLHYEGWLALPAAFRQKLGLSKGTALEAELVGGTIVLRPAAAGLKRPARAEAEELGHSAVTAVPVPAAVAAAPAKPRARRKQAAAPAALPPTLKSHGRRAKTADGGSAHAS